MDLGLKPHAPPGEVALEAGIIHVWSASLHLRSETLAKYIEFLSADERERAARFYFEVHRSRFIAGRGLLRVVLGASVKVRPQDIQFTYGSNGKPALAGHPVHFNVSHSEDRAVLAFALGAPLGVDLECMRPVDEMAEIAERFFSPAEWAALSALPPDRRAEAFFRCWTRKEAFIKATGEGLSHPLDRFVVSLDERAALLSVDGDPAKAGEWSLYHLAPAEGYVGAVAIRGRGYRVLSCWL